MKIHPVKHGKGDKNRYCGPAALSIVTGMTTGEAARLLRHLSGKASIKGTSTSQMRNAFAKCGVSMKPVVVKPQPPKARPMIDPWTRQVCGTYTEARPTLTQWLKDSQDIRTPGRVFLVSAGHHWQIITGRRFCCGRTGEIVSIRDKKANRRGRVRAVYELFTNAGISIPVIARKPKAYTDPAKKVLQALEREHGFKGKIEFDGGFKDYVIPACNLFPEGLYTMHHGWADTLERIEAAIEDPSLIVDGNISF